MFLKPIPHEPWAYRVSEEWSQGSQRGSGSKEFGLSFVLSLPSP